MPRLEVKAYDGMKYAYFVPKLLKMGFIKTGMGSYRHAYRRGNVVVKVPRSDSGFVDNIVEAYAYHYYRKEPDDNGFVYAPCRLLPNGCLMMVVVDFSSEEFVCEEVVGLPYWTNWIDGCQVGRYNGRIVAFDSANDVTPELRVDAQKWAGVIS